jgi:hypothetical protein
METVRTSEASVNFYVTTRRYIPKDSKLHTRRCENLKSHKVITPASILTSNHLKMGVEPIPEMSCTVY